MWIFLFYFVKQNWLFSIINIFKKGQRIDLRADALLSYQFSRVSETNLFFYGLTARVFLFGA